MLVGIMLGAIALAAPLYQDTTFAVDPSLRLDVRNDEGEIVVRTWDRNEVRVRADHSWRGVFDIERTSSTIRVRSRPWDDDDIRYVLTVPVSMSLDLGGSETDVSVEGSDGEVSVDVSDGEIVIRGGSGRVSARTNDGSIRVEEVEGRIRLFTMDGDITVDRASGDIEAETTDGAIDMVDVTATSVSAMTVDGDIWFDGVLTRQGSYLLQTHDGDVTLHIPEDTDARVRMALYDGDFSSDFSLTFPSWPRGRRVEFTMGGGNAELEIETFDGDIMLRRRR
jgi:DUF4097 and DUF4098 domain-containing protein YvlB